MDISYEIVKKLRESILLRERTEYDAMSDEELIKKAQSGDMYATSLAIQRYEDNGFLDRMLHKYFIPGEDRDELLQYGRESIWDAIVSWDGNGSFEAFAGMILKRRMIAEINRTNAGKRTIHSDAYSLNNKSDDGEGNETEFGDTLASDEQTPEDFYLSKEAEKKIYDYIKSRPKLERQAIMLAIDRYKVYEIAEKLGRPTKSIENALNRLRGNLKVYLNSPEYNESIDLSEATILTSLEKRVLKSIFNKIVDRGI